MKSKLEKKVKAATQRIQNTDHVAEAIKNKLMAMGWGFKCRTRKDSGNLEFVFLPKQRVAVQR